MGHASDFLHCSKMLVLDAATGNGADRYGWSAHYLGNGEGGGRWNVVEWGAEEEICWCVSR
ncbi:MULTISPECIES: DUF3077 domain-containing protein [unclassified Pseudomonas]|uniref:DUF3077 domain-containing protein n=1 Tax=Pseudomonas imrae TaxID=2992837 RepID=UPI003965AE3D